ncbi:HAMP domain-containing sensor histidine kinase [Treponema sp. J25]|uniref:sensor histidine kinase n=1 Tax=Treponema sp. J25 TaxID=2094121 RepID=UPI001048F330|nr:HAMP domain-containing sensor histidine kinase [Treponema sp. J25]TCW62026.1 hypothetical protein C5O22_03035 [Treponema sp. J25]
MYKLRRYWSVWILIPLIPILLILAYGQIRWAIDVGNKEQLRLSQDLYSAALQLRSALQNEIAVLPGIFTVSAEDFLEMLKEKNWTPFQERWNSYQRYALVPSLIKDLFIVKKNKKEGQIIAAWKWEKDRFVSTTVLPEGPGVFFSPLEKKEKSSSAAPPDVPPGVPPGASHSEFELIIRIDLEVLGNKLIPLLAKEQLQNKGDYYFRILDTYQKATVYVSGTNKAFLQIDELFCTPDLRYPLFNTNFFVLFSRLSRDLSAEGSAPAMSLLKFRRENLFIEPVPQDVPVQYRPMGPPPEEDPFQRSRWILEAVHVSGSLAVVTHWAVVRNISLSAIILFLITAALIALSRGVRKNQELAERQQEFIATVTHELKTPIAVIRSGANNLASGIISKGEKTREYGAMIEEQALRLLNMVDHLLLYSRLGNQDGLSLTRINMSHLTEGIIQEYLPRLMQEGFTHEFHIEGDLFVDGDPLALELVLTNLIENVFKHAVSGRFLGIDLWKESLTRWGKTKGWIVIQVRDRGKPLPRRERFLIFEAFYRGIDARREQRRGSGLGLSLVRRIISAHGGTVTYETDGNLGSRFIVRLPEGVKNE